MESLLVGTGYKPLQSVNYHDSHALGYERTEVLTKLVGFEMVGLVMSGWEITMGNCDWVVNP
jgi:hypothetical protein